VKILTILGTRPEIIRLSRVIERLDALCEHVLVHTGQNFDVGLSDIFFKELGVRAPDVSLDVRAEAFGAQVGQLFERSEALFEAERPDRVLVLGDTNSGLTAFIAKRMGVPVYHMEAGNRCFDDRVPEEVNRRVIDHSSDVLMPYTEGSRANLLREGIHPERIFVTGNPINEVLVFYGPQIEASDVLDRFGLVAGSYFLVTLHRQENVDDEGRLRSAFDALTHLAREYDTPVVCSIHPRTRSRLEASGLGLDDERVKLESPFGFIDFVALERSARAVLTDSGTVQEECCIFGVPTITMRDSTERPETIACGSNMLSGVAWPDVERCVRAALAVEPGWDPPPEYLFTDVSATLSKIVLGA
jgi:UDP-N-acetylglucosamine 2-epimerase (non-hydrolysing)